MKTLYELTGNITDVNVLLVPLYDFNRLSTDAARYRWLKANPKWLGWASDFRPDEVGREIDKAMKEIP